MCAAAIGQLEQSTWSHVQRIGFLVTQREHASGAMQSWAHLTDKNVASQYQRSGFFHILCDASSYQKLVDPHFA